MDAQARKKALFRAKLKEQAQKTRIDSPLVRYNDVDQPVCRVCDVALKSESLWPAHQASKKHHEAINNLKANASRQNSASSVKPAPVKELPKSKSDGLSAVARPELSPEFQKSKGPPALPANFFDKPDSSREKAGPGTPKSMDTGSFVKAGPLPHNGGVGKTMGEVNSSRAIQVKQGAETSISGSETAQTKGALPEGFFDNKEADLRARGIQTCLKGELGFMKKDITGDENFLVFEIIKFVAFGTGWIAKKNALDGSRFKLVWAKRMGGCETSTPKDT